MRHHHALGRQVAWTTGGLDDGRKVEQPMNSLGSRNLVQMMVSWCLIIGLGAIFVVNFDQIRPYLGLPEFQDGPAPANQAKQQIGTPARADRSVVLRAGSNGHFETRARINGRPIDVLVDTGASMVALTYEDAASAGIFPGDADFKQRVNTANGVARVAPVMLDQISIDDITIRNVRAVVAERGRLNQTLLGMTFLGQLSRAEMSRGILTLQE